MLIHLYLAFWRPDIRDKLVADGSPIPAMCDFVGNGESVVTDSRAVTCPACRETFLQALPTGTGKKFTWQEYLASPQAAPRVTMAQRAADAAKADAAWSTTPAPAVDVLATVKAPPDVWATNPSGWSSGLPATGPGWSSDWTTKR